MLMSSHEVSIPSIYNLFWFFVIGGIITSSAWISTMFFSLFKSMKPQYPQLVVRPNLLLTEIALTDAKAYFNLLNHEKVKEYIPEIFVPTDLDHAIADINHLNQMYHRKTGIFWGIYLSGEYIGSAGLQALDHTNASAEISYEVAPKYWGQGIATDCILSVTEYGFSQLKLKEIQSYMLQTNHSSIRCMEKCHYHLNSHLNRLYNHKITAQALYVKYADENLN